MAHIPGNDITASIECVGTYVPERVVTNAELETLLDTADAWIREKTGIEERRYAAEDELASDLAVRAIQDACGQIGIEPDDLQLVIVGTWTTDHLNPPTSSAVLRKLGISVPAFDINAGGCAGSIVALDVGARYVSGNPDARVAVVLTDVNSKMINWNDRTTAVFLGDGAGCYILSGRKKHLINSQYVVLPEHYELAWVPGGGRASPSGDPELASFHMDGRNIWKTLHAFVPRFLDQFLNGHCTREQLDLVVAHQANLRMLQSLLPACGIDMDKTHTTVERLGNTAGASVPLTVRSAEQTGRLNKGDTVLMIAFGAGMTVGASLWHW